MTERLITLPAVKEWLAFKEEQTGSDATLIRIIDAVSAFVMNYLNRDSFAAQEYTQNFRGNGKDTMLLRNWPVLSVSSVGVAGQSIAGATRGNAGLPSTGWLVSDLREAPQSIDLYGYGFWLGAPCQVVYKAGFETTQDFTIVGTAPITFTPNKAGQWMTDLGVTIDGVAATLVTTDPTAGQYKLDEWGTYTFSVDDLNKVAAVSYTYAPWDISFAAMEIVGEWFKRKDRIGLLSKTLGGQETITFSSMDMNEAARKNLQPYMNVVPV